MTASEHSDPSVATDEKAAAQIETVHTNERVPGHANYYEKNGLRTHGDDEDHDHEPPVRSSSLRLHDDLLIRWFADELQPTYVAYRHGLSLDWLANSGLPLRRCPSVHI